MDRSLRITFASALIIASSSSFTYADHCNDGASHSATKAVATTQVAATQSANIIATASAAGSFGTLLTAISAADLTDALKGEGPFTVFAPTDEAFAKLPDGTVDALLKDKARLAEILKYHVVAGEVTSAQVVKLTEAKTLQGQSLTIAAKDGVTVDGAKVVKADVMASNGVIHVIDHVLIPHAGETHGSAQ